VGLRTFAKPLTFTLDHSTMALPPTSSEIREAILQAAEKIRPKSQTDGSLQLNTLFHELKNQLGGHIEVQTEQEILTQWHDLVRTGYFAWGLNLSNPNPPFFHFTDRGNKALERLSRDPGNPSGYLRHLASVAILNPIAHSYLVEGLFCFEAGLYKASAVMVGASSESLVLELRDVTSRKLTQLGVPEPKGLSDWRVKSLLDALYSFLDGKKSDFPRELREEFESYFLAFAQQIRSSRNDAGHPSSVDPVTEESVHASFLILPELARLSNTLSTWILNELK
jgi:hypothetical protein